MKVVYNNFIPFKGYKAINLFGIVFARRGTVLTDEDLNYLSGRIPYYWTKYLKR